MSSWMNKWGKDSVCAISLTRLRPGKDKYGRSYVTQLPCKHRFYRKAIIDWISSGKQTCPICRYKVNLYYFWKINI